MESGDLTESGTSNFDESSSEELPRNRLFCNMCRQMLADTPDQSYIRRVTILGVDFFAVETQYFRVRGMQEQRVKPVRLLYGDTVNICGYCAYNLSRGNYETIDAAVNTEAFRGHRDILVRADKVFVM